MSLARRCECCGDDGSDAREVVALAAQTRRLAKQVEVLELGLVRCIENRSERDKILIAAESALDQAGLSKRIKRKELVIFGTSE